MKKPLFTLSLIICSAITFAQQADLVLEKIDEPQWDEGTHISITIKNNGDITSDTVTLKVWDLDISAKEAKELGFKKNDMWIFEENTARAEGDGFDYDKDWEVFIKIPPLQKGESTTVEVSLDHWVYDSNCEIGATIDCEKLVKEKNEKNNTLYFAAGG